MAHIINGANVTAQWYADNFSSSVFPRLDKAVIHTTETGTRSSIGWPGYNSGAAAPNVTLDCRGLGVRQHFPNNESSRALRDSSGTTVRENRDNVWQIELICHSDRANAIKYGGLWVGDLSGACYAKIAKMLIQLNKELGLPLISTVKWSPTGTGVRLTGPQYDAYRGILGHMHVSGNTHWDPGAFSWPKLQKAIALLQGGVKPPEGEDDLVTTQSEFNNFMTNWVNTAANSAAAYDAAVNKAVTAGLPTPAPTQIARAGKMLGVLPWWQILGRHDTAGKKPAPNMHGVMGEVHQLANAFAESGDLNMQLDEIQAEVIEDA